MKNKMELEDLFIVKTKEYLIIQRQLYTHILDYIINVSVHHLGQS